MPTTLGELETSLRTELGLNRREALFFLSRLTPTFELISLSDEPTLDQPAPAAWGEANTTGIAGQFTHTQLFNPVGSGVLIYVDMIIVGQAAAGDFILGHFDTALTTLQTTKAWIDQRRTGDPVGEMRIQVNAAVLVTVRTGVVNLLGDTNQVIPFPKPAVVPPGFGIGGLTGPTNSVSKESFFWREGKIL